MQTVSILAEASMALESVAGQVADLLAALPDAGVPIPGSEWTVRDAAAHLVSGASVYTEIANGAESPYQAPVGNGLLYRQAAATQNARRLEDLPETDPVRLSRLVLAAAGRLIDTTCGRPDDQPVSFHCGLPFTVAGLLCTSLSEHLLHGYDIAAAVGAPWPIAPAHAGLVLGGVSPLLPMVLNPETTLGVSAAFEIELRGVGRLAMRIDHGELHLGDAGTVDCVVSADPVAYLLVFAGRLSPWAAIALGLIAASGPRPELALRLNDMFIYP